MVTRVTLTAVIFLSFAMRSPNLYSQVQHSTDQQKPALSPTPQCKRIKTSFKNKAYTTENAPIGKPLSDIIRYLKQKEALKLKYMFHPRLRIGHEVIKKSLTKIHVTLDGKVEISPFRIWEITNPSGESVAAYCSDDIHVYPHYGYEKQYAVLLQVLGKKNLGRIYLTLVHAKNKWHIGYYHFQRWTHLGLDYRSWYQKKVEPKLKNKEYTSALINFDLATKLIRGNGHYQFNFYKQVKKEYDDLNAKFNWKQTVKDHFKSDEILLVASLYTEGGAGLFVRFLIPKEISARDITNTCTNHVRNLKLKPWFKGIDGLRCSYTIKGEDPSKEGRLGSMYIKSSEVDKKI